MEHNTLGEWSDGDDEWIWEIDESEWSNLRTDNVIRNIETEEMDVEDGEWSDLEAGDIIRNVQLGDGKKRKREDEIEETEQDFYVKEGVKKHHSKKFRLTATDHTIRFNNNVDNLDLLQSIERTYQIFEHILNDVTEGMNEKDQVRFVLRSDQLETPISIPFMPLHQLTPERVFSHVQRVVQSNRDFRLNDTVNVDIIHVEAPQGSGRKPRNIVNIREYLHKKRTVITVVNDDDLCLACALVIAIARVEKEPNYHDLLRPGRRQLEKRARALHVAANVPLGPCGLPEVALFQKHLTSYEITVVSGINDNSIIYPPQPSTDRNVTPIYLYLHDNHYDVITKMPGFLNRSYFCHTCRRAYDKKSEHTCPESCKSCGRFDCVPGVTVKCKECDRTFKSETCYNNHKEPVGRARSICQTIRKCENCGKVMDVRHLNAKGHICGKKCPTCGVILNRKDSTEHKCYIQKIEQKEESQYNELLFFDFECNQETGTHKPNLCIVHNEAGEEWMFQGNDTTEKFCEWLISEKHRDCIAVAHNFQGYDGYFIQEFLNNNAIKYDVLLRGAKILSLTISMFNIKFIDSLNFIPMALSKFPKTFDRAELCKGYFPHRFNTEENQDYVGPIPPVDQYSPDGMKPEERETFLAWHKELVESNYLFNFREEIIKYCRSDVDILRKCCMDFREMLRDKTDGIDPFNTCLTIASYCHEVYRTKYLKKDSIAVFQHDRQLKMKQSNMAIKWLSYEMESEDIYIQHVRNGGEKRIGKYSLDGYCEEYNAAYEFQGCFWHGKYCNPSII